MRYLVYLVVLLAYSWLFCEAGKSYEWPPYTIFIGKMDRLRDSMKNVSANLKIALEYDWEAEPEFRTSSSFREIVRAFKSLKTDDYCTSEIVTNLTKLTNHTRGGIRMDQISNDSQFSRAYSFIVVKMERECFNNFEEKWKNDSRTDRFERDFPELTCLGELLTNRSDLERVDVSADLMQLNGAIRFMSNPYSKRNKLTGNNIRSALSNYTSQTEKMSKDEAEEVIEERLVKPCAKLLEQPEVETFFRHITTIGAGFEYLKWFKPSELRGSDFRSIVWTARYIFCETFLTKIDRKRLARKMALELDPANRRLVWEMKLDSAIRRIKSTQRGRLSSLLKQRTS